MKKQHLFCIIFFILIWGIISSIVKNDILVPYPSEVLSSLSQILSKKESYGYIFLTLLRVVKGYLLSILTSFILTCLIEENDKIRHFIEPIIVLIKTIPNISYIILAIIWLGSEGSVSAVTFMILFPICFEAFVSKLDDQKRRLQDVMQIYPTSFIEKIRICIIPELYIESIEVSKTALSMGLKVAIMAEILAAVRHGIGKEFNYARITLNSSDILAWTIVILILSYSINLVFQLLLQRRLKEEQYGKSKCGNSTNN